MKIFSKICCLVAVLALTAGCIEDKGNYEYSDINGLTIDMGKGEDRYAWMEITDGNTFDITPVIRFLNGSTDMSHLTFRWYIWDYDKPHPEWTTLNFKWKPDELLYNKKLVFEVTDTKTGIQYLNYMTITVNSRFDEAGLQILADRDGRAEFSLLRIDKRKIENGVAIIEEVTSFPDVYAQQNGVPLGQGALKIHEHFCSESGSVGQILLLTRNGAEDISGKDYKQQIELKEAFLDGQYPAGVDYISDAMFMTRVNVVADQDGYLYVRVKSTHKLYHSEYFLPKRVMLDEEELQGCKLILAPFRNLKACLIHDTNKKRLLVMVDVETSSRPGDIADENAGRVLQLPNPVDMPANFLPLDNLSAGNILWVGYYRSDGGSAMGYTIVFEKGGKYFCQEFEVEKEYFSLSYSVSKAKVTEIQGLPGTPTCIYGFPYRNQNRQLICAVGKQMYLYDRDHSTLTLYGKEFDADITALDGENYSSYWLGIGLANGRALLVNATGIERPEDQLVFYDSGAGAFGRIKDVRYKIGTGNYWSIDEE